MFGVRLEGPAYFFCNNSGVTKSTIIPESVLHNKHNIINYNLVREAVAADIPRIGKEDVENNLVDLLTNVMTGQKRLD